MFLIGGPPYCGTTLLTVMLDQQGAVCLNEPDFHDPGQSHNGLPVLQRRYPGRDFPPRGDEPLDWDEAFDLMRRCAAIVEPDRLGFKFCSEPFVQFARRFRAAGFPVVAIVRDVRDALVRPLKSYIGGEAGLVAQYRLVWAHRALYDHCVRYEDLVHDPCAALAGVAAALGLPAGDRSRWDPESVTPAMLYPRERHAALRTGRVVGDRVGIWRTSGKQFGEPAHALAGEMGY